MKQYEHKHVRMAYRFCSLFSKKAFDKQLCSLLAEMGDKGWELKSSITEGILTTHIHFVFARERQATA